MKQLWAVDGRWDMEGIDTPPPPHHGSIFTALLVSMGGILAATLGLVVYHLVILKYCLTRQTADTRPPPPQLSTSTGLDPNILETIPILTYSSKQKDSLFHTDQTECAVCLEELEDDDKVRLLPTCRHAFHITCIDQWFIENTNCPVCRSPVTAPERAGSGRLNPDQLLEHLLRHGESCVLPPTDGKLRLKRSLSMGQSYVIIDIGRESGRAGSSSSLGRSRSYRARSMRQLDRASSSVRRSFSRLRMGLSGSSNQILPYWS